MIAAIELAMLQALKDASTSGKLGYAWAVLETFPDDLEAYLTTIGNLRTPAAWVSWVSASDSKDGGDEDGVVSTCRFVLAVAAQNFRNEQNTRHGDGAMPGSYQLAVDAARVLSGHWLAEYEVSLQRPISVLSAAPLAQSEQMKRQQLSAIAIVLECRAGMGVFDEVLGEFRQFHADWDVPNLGNVAAPLPAADPDAEDLVEVPQ